MYMVGWAVQDGVMDLIIPDERMLEPDSSTYVIRDLWVPAKWLDRVADLAFEAEVYRDSPNHFMGICFHYAIARKPLTEWAEFFRAEEDLVERLQAALMDYAT